jgi:hypothetical protein
VNEPLGWLSAYAAKNGLSYEPEADERWLRAFEPFATLRTPIRYEHALHAIGAIGSLSIARMVVAGAAGVGEMSAWIAFVQDGRLPGARAAATNDFDGGSAGPLRATPFAEPTDLVSLPRRRTGDDAFDYTFASFSTSEADVVTAITPSLRKLVIGWRVPIHFEVRPGAFVLAPVSLGADPTSLAWLVGALPFFGEKAGKRVK